MTTSDRTHARTGPEKPRAEAQNPTQNSNTRTHTHTRQTGLTLTHRVSKTPLVVSAFRHRGGAGLRASTSWRGPRQCPPPHPFTREVERGLTSSSRSRVLCSLQYGIARAPIAMLNARFFVSYVLCDFDSDPLGSRHPQHPLAHSWSILHTLCTLAHAGLTHSYTYGSLRVARQHRRHRRELAHAH